MDILQHIKGDKTIWAIIAALAIFSFLPVYSASTNLVYVVAKVPTTTSGYLMKHGVLLLFGFIIIYVTHKIPYRYFSGLAVIMMPIVWILLAYTLFQPNDDKNAIMAARWISLPFVRFQTSTLATVILMIYIARYFAKNKDKEIRFQQSLLPLWLPVVIVTGLILPANFSTAFLLFAMVIVLAFFANYPIRYLVGIGTAGIVGLLLFVLVVKAFPDQFKNTRVQTWINRVDNFSNVKSKSSDQSHKAQVAIYSGGITGQGPGKSVQKNFLPQSSSDFIYAIIVEEYGLLGALVLLSMYLLLLFRIVKVASKIESIFGTLVVLGLGVPIVFQALVNMAVAVGLFPVTGQTLPLISAGGTSIWMTCFAFGIILSVSASEENNSKEIEGRETENPLDVLHEAIG